MQVRGASAFRRRNRQAPTSGHLHAWIISIQAGVQRKTKRYMIIGGIDVTPAGNIHVMPNVMATIYASSNADTEVIPRMTLHYRF